MNVALRYPIARLQTLAASRRNSIVGGPFGSNLVSADYVPEGVPVIRGTNLRDSKSVSHTGLVFVTERKADELHTNNAHPGDIVFTQRGTLGQVGIIPRDSGFTRYVISQSQMKITVDPLKASVDYLYYYFRMQSTISYIENHALQAGVPHINLGILKRFEVVLPPLSTQRKIAAILTAYDDLIEVKKRRIALLEKMAEELYREWFVRMRFPGHQDTRFVKGIPEGWHFEFGSEFFDHVKGKSYSSNEISDEEGKCFFITLKSFHRRGGYRKEGLKYFSGKYKDIQCVVAGDVVMAVTDMTQDRAVVGEVARIPNLSGKKSVISLDVIRLIPKDMTTAFLYAYMRFSGFANYIKEFANGANVLHLKPDLVGKQRLLFPPKDLRDRFSEYAEPIFQKMDSLEEASDLLTKTRDLLLPRLISGKLSVENLDIQFPPSMCEEAA